MNITNLPLSEGPLDIILKYSANYSACFRTCRILRNVVDRIFKDVLQKDFEMASATPFLTYQRKKFALYSKIPEHGLNLVEGSLLFLTFSAKYYAYSTINTVVRDRSTNAVVAKPFAAAMNEFGFITPTLLKIDQYMYAIEADTEDDLAAIGSSTNDIKTKIQPYIPYSLETLSVKIGRNIVAINKDGLLHFFTRDRQRFIQTSARFPDKVFYKNERLFLFSDDKLIDYDFINDRINYSIHVPAITFISVIDVDNDYVLVNLNIKGPSILHLPTQKYLQSFQESEWTLSCFDCMIYKGLNDPHTQRRYYLKKRTNELSHFSA